MGKLIKNLSYEEILQKYKNKKAKCERLNIPFTLDECQFYDLITSEAGKCYYTGVELNSINASIDRIDPELGYVMGNVVLCEHGLNARKSQLSLTDLSLLYKALCQKNEEQEQRK